MDDKVRSNLQNATQQARRLLERDIAEQLEGDFDILANGTIGDQPGSHLDDSQRLIRTKIVETIRHRADGSKKTEKLADAVSDYIREAAFTILNRYIALKMLEERGLVQQCITKGDQSSGFKEFCLAAPGLAMLPDKGYRLYLECLFDELSIEVKILFDRHNHASLLWPRRNAFDALLAILNADDLAGVWKEDETIGWVYQYFNSKQDREDARYDKAGKPKAPQNSRELAVRNQFFTPRYVVEFLTDNTLGRLWYEMRQGNTALKDACRYLVRRPDEVFLSEAAAVTEESADGPALCAKLMLDPALGSFLPFTVDRPQRLIDLAHCVNAYERHPLAGRSETGDEWSAWKRRDELAACESLADIKTQDLLDVMFFQCRADRHGGGEGISRPVYVRMANEVRSRLLAAQQPDRSQEELLNAPVFIPFRAKKDPRDLKVLDPACGSSHFLLYCFDLLVTIYEEAWHDEQSPASEITGQAMRKDYSTIEALRQAVPGLILRHNLHGIDIDPRCAQIGAFALWMRAQRAFGEFALPKDLRPPITRSNIVVAEPMPGEDDLFEEFLRGLKEDRLESLIRDALKVPANKQVRATTAMAESLCELVRTIWDIMKLAGEAGSLLQVDRELDAAIAKGREEWEQQLPLFRVTEYELGAAPKTTLLRAIPGDDADFWTKSETLVLRALELFAEHLSKEGTRSFRRTLFADDASRGFAFIDLTRKRFDTVLMNPPFGDTSVGSKKYLVGRYDYCGTDLFTMFVAHGATRLVHGGRCGAITNRTGFFTVSQEDWRQRTLLGEHRLALLADLGYGVLDALVETAAYVIQSGPSLRDADFLRAVADADKEAAVLRWVIATKKGEQSTGRFTRTLDTFTRLPSYRIAFWMPRRILAIYSTFPRYGLSRGDVQVGLQTSDNFRFLRLAWEVDPKKIVSTRAATCTPTGVWCFYAKGGEYAPYYADIHLLVKWHHDGSEVKAFTDDEGNQISYPRNEHSYFLPGLTYSERTTSNFSARVLPAGCCFDTVGPRIAPKTGSPLADLGVYMSRPYAFFLEFAMGSADFVSGGTAARHYTPRSVGELPFPTLMQNDEDQLAEAALRCWRSLATIASRQETDRNFCRPWLREASTSLDMAIANANRERVGLLLEAIDGSWVCEQETRRLLGLDDEALTAIESEGGCHPGSFPKTAADPAMIFRSLETPIEKLIDQVTAESGASRSITKLSFFADRQLEVLAHVHRVHPAVIAQLAEESNLVAPEVRSQMIISAFSFAVGCILGRWRFSESFDRTTDDPTGRLPVSPPAAWPSERSADRPSWAMPYGVAIDDVGHDADVLARVMAVLSSMWGDAADRLIREALTELGASKIGLRGWIATKFFDAHLKMYSASRRQAPNLWQLATNDASFSIWLNYHTATSDTLFGMLNEYVAPKLRHEKTGLDRVRAEAGGSPTFSQRGAVENQERFVSFLSAFQDELSLVAALWRPNHDDGVLVNACPLWRLFGHHKAWQKECKDSWNSLVAGDYDWAHLAMHLWPERIVPKCQSDVSIAIAHELDGLFWIKEDGKWRATREPSVEIEDQKQRRTTVVREQFLEAFAALASSEIGRQAKSFVWQSLREGQLDDHKIALWLWPDRVIEKARHDQAITDVHELKAKDLATSRACVKLKQRYSTPELEKLREAAEAFCVDRDSPLHTAWEALSRGEFDDQPLALELWPDRVIDKCVQDVDLAEKHNLRDCFWYNSPDKGWRLRQAPEDEIAWESGRRYNRTVKDALEKFLATPSPEGGTKRGRAKAVKAATGMVSSATAVGAKRKPKTAKARIESEELF